MFHLGFRILPSRYINSKSIYILHNIHIDQENSIVSCILKRFIFDFDTFLDAFQVLWIRSNTLESYIIY